MKVEEVILICAVRYVLGRKTYVVEAVCCYLVASWDAISDKCKRIIRRDIKQELERCHQVGKLCGMKNDDERWRQLLEELKEKQVEKKNNTSNSSDDVFNDIGWLQRI